MGEMDEAMGKCKIGKAAGIDELQFEQIKHFISKTKEWIQMMATVLKSLPFHT